MRIFRYRARSRMFRFAGTVGPAWRLVPALLLLSLMVRPASPPLAGDAEGSSFRLGGRSIPLATMRRLDPQRFAAGLEALAGHEEIRDRRWHALLDLLAVLPPRARLPIVQHFFAGFPYRPDPRAAHGGDRWSSIAEFLESGGDCEEFAIAKYRALKDSGIPAAALHIVLARDPATGADHAWLQVTLAGRTLVLDNRLATLARPAQMARFRPVALLDDRRLLLIGAP